MPDLDVVTTWTCFTNRFWEMAVPSLTDPSKQYQVRWERQYHGDVQYDWTCTCQSFKFNRTCKHIDKVKTHRCGWNETLEPAVKAEYVGSEPRCPQCGGPVEVVKVGV